MKLLVSGGAGYIGSVVAHRLVEAGHETVVLENLFKEYERAAPEELPVTESATPLPTNPYGVRSWPRITLLATWRLTALPP